MDVRLHLKIYMTGLWEVVCVVEEGPVVPLWSQALSLESGSEATCCVDRHHYLLDLLRHFCHC